MAEDLAAADLQCRRLVRRLCSSVLEGEGHLISHDDRPALLRQLELGAQSVLLGLSVSLCGYRPLGRPWWSPGLPVTVL